MNVEHFYKILNNFYIILDHCWHNDRPIISSTMIILLVGMGIRIIIYKIIKYELPNSSSNNKVHIEIPK